MANNDVAIRVEGPLATPNHTQMPNVANLNINKSSRVQIGPKFVTVTQNVQNAEMVKGLKADWYLRRRDWQAMPAYDVEYLDTPVPYVILGHSALKFCETKYECIKEVLYIQRDNLRRELDDIAPNFLIAGNGDVFEGRGANVVPAMVSSWNRKSVTIMLLGNYQIESPRPIQLERIEFLLNTLVEKGVLKEDYVMYGHCQVKTQIVSPGYHVVDKLGRFSHWSRDNITTCLTA